MSRRPEPEGALYVKLPADAVDKLDRAAESLGVHKKHLIAGLVARYVDPDTRHGLQALGSLSYPQALVSGPRRVTVDMNDGSPTMGAYSFQSYGPSEPSEVLTVAQAAELLQVDEKTILQLAAAGDIPCKKLGLTYRFSRTALIAWLAG